MNSHTPRHTPVRPPQPVAVAPHAPTVTYSPNAALLIDFDNVTMGIRSDLQTELRNLLASDIIKGKVQLRRAYADWRRYPQYVAPLAEASIDMIMAPAYGSSKKNATDIRLAIDALELVFTRPEIGTYILLSGDSDFSTLVIKLKEYGKYVIGVGIRESSSDLLVMNCDEYYSYNALAGLVRAGSDGEPAGRRDPWELVTEALARMQRNGDVMRADRLKQVMQDIDSSFDEKNLGMSKFSRFVTEAAGRGLLSVTKLDTGQLEIAPPRRQGEVVPVARAPEVAENGVEAPAGDAERSGSRRSRGRRDRGRGGRGGEGRGEARGEPARSESTPAVAGSITPVSSERSSERSTERVAAPAKPAVHTAPVGRPSDGIGVGGERLTRDEAFQLVRQAVGAVATDERPARATDVRVKARELLGRDSLSLTPENFTRILRDAHDADVIDLRRRGDDYEVAPAVTAAPVSEQLNVAAAATRAATPAPTTPAAPRGMGPRGAPSRSRSSFGARVGAPPPELL
ncbi:MAG TPA: NYN domain-containing protein, partial [Gemmatimonadaceae bacterium]|nr:NYN domain-containing protein [Gemmatimonadaceae bacterium]